MWLLDTLTLKLHYFTSPEAVEEGYMILSHVWDESKELEMTFQNIQRIHERCASSGEDPRDLVNTKIRKCCELGERHGYKWAWIDTCCIDKSSSAELMETINAMYQYYALCLVCYVYLPDFWDHDNPEKIRYSMRHTLKPHTQLLVKTRWQQRGWTLQELIAPRIVHFLSSYWEYLGTKNDLADGLERGLGIPASVLRHEQSPLEFSVAQRMSWAANRKTTRPEDEAYSLLGLFGIKMPTLYGEGSKAFQRLQEEIIKQTGDSTLFAWGVSASLDNLRDYPNHAQTGLLASGPFDFSSSRGIQIQKSSNPLHQRIEFRTTPHGPILARIPLLRINGQTFGDLSWSQGGAHLVLVLRKCARTSALPIPLYDIGLYDTREAHRVSLLRIAQLETLQDRSPGTHFNHRTSLRTILLLRHRPRIQRREPLYLPLNHSFRPPICLPEHLIQSFLYRRSVSEVSVVNAHLPFLGNTPLVIAFREQGLYEADVLYAVVQVGRCTSHTTNGEDSGSLWATFRGSPGSRWEQPDLSHQCPEDHLLYWPDRKKCFVFKFHVADVMDDRIAKWLFDIAFTISVTGTLIMTRIALDYRPLLKCFDYRDVFEEKEEGMTETRMATDTDGQHSRQSPSFSTLGKDAIPSTLLIDSEEITTVDEDCQSVVDASLNYTLCRGVPLHLFRWTCSQEPLAVLTFLFPFSVAELIQSCSSLSPKHDDMSTCGSFLLMYPATLNWNFLCSEGCPLLLQ